jgi:uncharacterized protein
LPCEIKAGQNFNELDQIKMMNRQAIFGNEEYRLTINPTLECNFNCWYCYEEHPAGKMNKETMNAITKHLKLKIEDKSLRHLNLDWFGGEPLLYFDEIMYPLSSEIKKMVEENEISFASTITTNGYLINKMRIEKFKEIGLTNYQITLDGNEEMHNKIRFDKNKTNTFRTIINNINDLIEYLDANVTVRINYTEKTLSKINEIIDLFPDHAKHKILVLFQQVWQDSMKKNISAEKNKKEFEKRGIKVRDYEPNTKYYTCYADRLHQAVINFDGKVFKCTARDFNSETPDGELLDNGEIQWNIPSISKRFGSANFENEYCLECTVLPVCMGPCSQKIVEFPKQYDEQEFKKICLLNGVKEIIEKKIEAHYETIKDQIDYV